MRYVCSGSLHVALPRERAAVLFTPEGERAWAPGWAPEYPEVTYDLTALSPEADLAGFAAGFDDMMAAWERAIAAAL
jgi:hypothetical protein